MKELHATEPGLKLLWGGSLQSRGGKPRRPTRSGGLLLVFARDLSFEPVLFFGKREPSILHSLETILRRRLIRLSGEFTACERSLGTVPTCSAYFSQTTFGGQHHFRDCEHHPQDPIMTAGRTLDGKTGQRPHVSPLSAGRFFIPSSRIVFGMSRPLPSNQARQ